MLLKPENIILENDYEALKNSRDENIIIDLLDIKYLSSKDITKLLVLIKNFNKKIELKNVNDYIYDTLKVLNLQNLFILN